MEFEPGERILVTADRDLRVAATDGSTTVIIPGGGEVSIPATLLSQALAAGARAVNGENAQGLSDEETVEALIAAMGDILNEGDPAKVTGQGEPRFSALKARVGDFTAEQRSRAWEQYISEYVSSGPADDAELDKEDEERWDQSPEQK